MGKKILLIAPPGRKDFYDYLERDHTNEYHQIWYDNKKQLEEAKGTQAAFIKEMHFWGDYMTPEQLLRQLKPERIVLMEMIDLHQIATIVVARKWGIETIYLDHGAAGDRETSFKRMQEPGFALKKLSYIFKRILTLQGFIKTRVFYMAGLWSCGATSKKKYLKLSYLFLKHPPLKALYLTKFNERNPSTFIVFNQANAEQYSLYFDLNKSKTYYTGVPNFDTYFMDVEPAIKNYIVFIDHPYLEANLFSWTTEHHKKIASTLEHIARQHGTKIYVKLHPFSNKQRWDDYDLNPDYVEVIQSGEFTKLYLESSLIMGFASSLFTGFLSARKNVVLLGWHPEPRFVGANFFDYNICHLSLDMEDAINQVSIWKAHNLCYENVQGYTAFLKRYNFPFDGQATQRIIDIIGA